MPFKSRDMGKATGFSVATSSRVLNRRSRLVTYSLKQQILTTAKELVCPPNLVGHSLRSARTTIIGLIID